MKRAAVIVLTICLLMPAAAYADGILPSLTDLFGVDMPSMSVALRRLPDEETMLDDGSVCQSYSNVTECDFNIFGRHVDEYGCAMGTYTVAGGILDAVVEKQGSSFSLRYDDNEGTAVFVYPAETNVERLKISRYLPDNTGYLPDWETVFFGSYEQDNNRENGSESIEWIVLEDDGERKLLLSKYALDFRAFNTFYAHMTWETSSLRTWLNMYFLNVAFSSEEQEKIIRENVPADGNPQWDTPAGNDTLDKVFLLSIDEANRFFPDNDARKCAPTDYSIAQGAGVSGIMVGDRATGWWFLRSPGSSTNYAALVSGTGYVGTGGRNVNFEYGVRPAIWLKF